MTGFQPTTEAIVMREALSSYRTAGSHETCRASLLACIPDGFTIADLYASTMADHTAKLVAALAVLIAASAAHNDKRGNWDAATADALDNARAALVKVTP